MSEYRNGFKEVKREVNWTIMSSLPTIILVTAIVVLLGWGLQSTGIISMNIDREVTQHSRQYVESKQASLNNLYSQYAALQADVAKNSSDEKIVTALQAQQMALLDQMRQEATNIPTDKVPAKVKFLLAQ